MFFEMMWSCVKVVVGFFFRGVIVMILCSFREGRVSMCLVRVVVLDGVMLL